MPLKPLLSFYGARARCGLLDSGFSFGMIRDSLFARQIWGSGMGKPHPVELRERMVAFVEEGHSHRSAAARFRVSVRFVNDMVILKRETGGLQPRRQGNGGGHGKLEPVRAWLRARMARKGALTLDDLVAELSDRHGITIHRVSVWRFLRSLGLTHKKAILYLTYPAGDGRQDATQEVAPCPSCPAPSSTTKKPPTPT